MAIAKAMTGHLLNSALLCWLCPTLNYCWVNPKPYKESEILSLCNHTVKPPQQLHRTITFGQEDKREDVHCRPSYPSIRTKGFKHMDSIRCGFSYKVCLECSILSLSLCVPYPQILFTSCPRKEFSVSHCFLGRIRSSSPFRTRGSARNQGRMWRLLIDRHFTNDKRGGLGLAGPAKSGALVGLVGPSPICRIPTYPNV